jgi:hypothetical protein
VDVADMQHQPDLGIAIDRLDQERCGGEHVRAIGPIAVHRQGQPVGGARVDWLTVAGLGRGGDKQGPDERGDGERDPHGRLLQGRDLDDGGILPAIDDGTMTIT